jgi:hypothetical protein
MSIKETGTKFFKNEEEMDTFLEDLQPGSTVVIKEWANVSLAKEMDYDEELALGRNVQATWMSGKNLTKSEYYPNGITADDGDIYWYSHDKLWQLIPAFG